jgi:hypothetical protein
MRRSISAQSWASVPPEPAWMSRKALEASISPENMRRNSSSPTRVRTPRSPAMASTVSESPSSAAMASEVRRIVEPRADLLEPV